ncbi:helix-turn-helix transcriptional regulator [Aureimonas ureilytica]|uniref:helix-turn-helix transcriptional regulator n=1 Tax=Aureimonas ureilytica TaxID=401562 RepID=UPI00128EB136|nr:hypothetical protein [Aureimonas ureilytica]
MTSSFSRVREAEEDQGRHGGFVVARGDAAGLLPSVEPALDAIPITMLTEIANSRRMNVGLGDHKHDAFRKPGLASIRRGLPIGTGADSRSLCRRGFDQSPAHRSSPMPRSASTFIRVKAAELLGISPSSVDKWVRKGVIPKPRESTEGWGRAAIERVVSGQAASVGATDDSEAIYAEWKRQEEQKAPSPTEIGMQGKEKRKRP